MNLDAPKKLARTFSFYYDQNWLGWSPRVVEATLREKFGADPSKKQLERVEATREVLRTDRFAFQPLLFENVTRAFCGLPLSADVWQPVDAAQMAYGLYAMRQLVGNGPLEEDAVGEQVRAYMAAVLAREPIGIATEWFGYQPARAPLRRIMHVPEITEKGTEAWEEAMAKSPETPRALFRDIQSRFGPRENMDMTDKATYRHLIRLSSVWASMHKRDAAPTSNPFA